MREKRRFARLDTKVIVKWTKIDRPLDSAATSSDITKNISMGGICLTTAEELKIGDDLKLEIRLSAKNIVNTQGRVVWINEPKTYTTEGKKEYDVGVEFIGIDDEDREEIYKFVVEVRSRP